jgi:hypothetical protein
MSRGNPATFPKWKARPARPAPGALKELQYVRKIAVSTGIPARDLPAIGGTALTICTGSRRLTATNAGLMVIGTMAGLHKCASDDWKHLCDLIYIIGLGKPVVVASTWKMTGGDPSRLEAQASGIVSHASAALLKPCTFVLSRGLVDEHAELHFALEHCAERPKSQWKVCLDRGQPLVADGVKVATIKELAGAIFKLRALNANGCRGYAFCLK